MLAKLLLLFELPAGTLIPDVLARASLVTSTHKRNIDSELAEFRPRRARLPQLQQNGVEEPPCYA
jgi:hypothetical protein